MNDSILIAKGIWKSYNTKIGIINEVLRGVDIDLIRGEFVSIVGPSGVGKSTLLYILGSLEIPEEGDVKLISQGVVYEYPKINNEKLSEIRNKTIGFVFQFHHLLAEFSAIENVMIPSLIRGIPFSEANHRSLYLLERVGVAQVAHQKPSELSGGEQQRVAIARALVNNPEIVIADEPTGNLDSANAYKFLNLMRELQNEFNLTLIVATHSNDVAKNSDRILKMIDGHIIDN